MTREAYQRGDWQAVIAAHQLESHDSQEWLRYGVALLQTLTPGPDVGKQQQQAALAFVQAQKEGAAAQAVVAAQRQSVLLSLAEALRLAGVESAAPSQPEAGVGEDQQRLLMIVAGFFNLHLPLELDCPTQIAAARDQLHAAKIARGDVERCMLLAIENQPNLSSAAAKQLLSQLSCSS